MTLRGQIGIIGGTGALGSAIALALLETGTVRPSDLVVANRSGELGPLADWQEVRVTTSAEVLVHAAGLVLLAVPPDQAAGLRIHAPGRLVVSVMAGVSLARLAEIAGSGRVVRAMSSPAARRRLAFSPFMAGPAASAEDVVQVRTLFAACGIAEEIEDEALLDVFTALTGPVPGFVAAVAAAMAAWAEARGAPPATAERAVRQLFLASGRLIAESPNPPSAEVAAMIAYGGTTAAGLDRLAASPFAEALADALDAAARRAGRIAEG
ncbi:MAG: pyrroline-5-carboxylate reductase family protein [Paracoccaceae bacterium]